MSGGETSDESARPITDTQKSILITGCSSGIGYDAAKTLAATGWRVLATCRKMADAKRLSTEGLEAFVLDLADEASVAQGAETALTRTDGQLFALFNNGAFAIPGASEDLPRAAYRDIFETNLFGQIDLTNRILPAMRKNGRGRIIMNSSILGFAAMRYRGAYNATKFAMEGLTDTMRLENPDPDIHFILIEPGPVTSRIRENSVPHFERWIDTDNSRHADAYQSTVKPRLYTEKTKPDRFELPASAVTEKLLHALTAHKPKSRYFVTTPTYIAHYLRRLLPLGWCDAIQRRL